MKWCCSENNFGKGICETSTYVQSHNVSHKKFEEIPEDEWSRVMRVNIEGVWRVSKSVVPHMRKENYGKIYALSPAVIESNYILNNFELVISFFIHSEVGINLIFFFFKFSFLLRKKLYNLSDIPKKEDFLVWIFFVR